MKTCKVLTNQQKRAYYSSDMEIRKMKHNHRLLSMNDMEDEMKYKKSYNHGDIGFGTGS